MTTQLDYFCFIFQANWYKAEQYCRFHGMHLASIDSADEQRDLQEHIQVLTIHMISIEYRSPRI